MIVAEFTHHGVKFAVDGSDAEEVLGAITELITDEKFGEAAVAIQQQALAAAAVASTPPSGATAATPPPGSPGGAKVCPKGHGPFKDLAGQTTKSGQPYKHRYYCQEFSCREFAD